MTDDRWRLIVSDAESAGAVELVVIDVCEYAVSLVCGRFGEGVRLPPSTVDVLARFDRILRGKVPLTDVERSEVLASMIRSDEDLVADIESGELVGYVHPVVRVVMLMAREVIAMVMRGAWLSDVKDRAAFYINNMYEYVVVDYPQLGEDIVEYAARGGR